MCRLQQHVEKIELDLDDRLGTFGECLSKRTWDRRQIRGKQEMQPLEDRGVASSCNILLFMDPIAKMREIVFRDRRAYPGMLSCGLNEWV